SREQQRTQLSVLVERHGIPAQYSQITARHHGAELIDYWQAKKSGLASGNRANGAYVWSMPQMPHQFVRARAARRNFAVVQPECPSQHGRGARRHRARRMGVMKYHFAQSEAGNGSGDPVQTRTRQELLRREPEKRVTTVRRRPDSGANTQYALG